MNVELEGMLLVLSRRDTPEVRNALRAKMQAFSEVFAELMGDEKPLAAAPVVVDDEVKCDEGETGEQESSYDIADQELTRVAPASQLTSLDEIRETENEAPVYHEDTEDEDVPVFDLHSECDHEECSHAYDPSLPEDEVPLVHHEEEVEVDFPAEPEEVPFDEADAEAAEQEPEAEEAHVESAHVDPLPMPEAEPKRERADEIKVDELLSRREARDLRRAFTLNDKFRFRRELFGSNDALFGQVLTRLSELEDMPEAESYLYDYLGLDPDNDDVKDFVAIVANHFAAI